MNEIIYLEPDDDITGVIGRIKEIAPNSVALVIPRGGNIAQSIVNLKLLKREIEKINKSVSLVANDKISKNLASQVGIAVYSTVQEAKAARPAVPAAASAGAFGESIKINRYNKEEDSLAEQNTEPEIGDAVIEDPTEEEPEHTVVETPEETASESSHDVPPPPVHAERPVKHIGTHAQVNAPTGSKFRAKNVSSRKKPIIIIASIVLLAALATSVVILPKADASIVLKTESIKADPTVIIDKNIVAIDTKAGTIPGTLVSAEDELTKEYSASGTKNAGTKATGQVVFYNYDYQDTNPKSISAGTTLVASGKNFITAAAVTVSGASATIVQGAVKVTPSVSSKVTITANDAGEDYNLAAGRFDISGYSSAQKQLVYAQSDAALSGGTTKKITVVSDADLKKAKDETQAELDQRIISTIIGKESKDNKKIINSQVKITNNSADGSKKSGDEAGTFTYKIVAKGETLAYTESQMREVIAAKVTADLPIDQMLVNPEKTELVFDVKEAIFDEGKFTLTVHFDGKKGKKYDKTIIQKQITNQKYGTALSIIQNLAEVEKATLTIWPKFVPRTPILKSRVKVKFDYSN
jgi:predicted transcriptional regulator YdeE